MVKPEKYGIVRRHILWKPFKSKNYISFYFVCCNINSAAFSSPKKPVTCPKYFINTLLLSFFLLLHAQRKLKNPNILFMLPVLFCWPRSENLKTRSRISTDVPSVSFVVRPKYATVGRVAKHEIDCDRICSPLAKLCHCDRTAKV